MLFHYLLNVSMHEVPVVPHNYAQQEESLLGDTFFVFLIHILQSSLPKYLGVVENSLLLFQKVILQEKRQVYPVH